MWRRGSRNSPVGGNSRGGVKLLIEGFVLAGGRSSRFESNKALALWEGKPLLVYALEAVEALGVTPRVVAREFFPFKDLASAFVISERPDLGPAEGLRAALTASSRPWNLVLCTDMPRVTAEKLRSLLQPAGDADRPVGSGDADRTALPEAPAVCFRDPSGRSHPFPGLYHRSLLGVLETLGPGGSMQRILEKVEAKRVDLEDPRAAEFLWNINRPQDLENRVR